MQNTIDRIIKQLHAAHLDCKEGAVADYIPELTKADPEWFGICVFTTDGYAYEVGDTNQAFTIQSISKAFTYGMILDKHGVGQVKKRIGVEPSGEAFNSISLDPETGRPFNPMINAGAITATGMVKGKNFEDRFEKIRQRFSDFAGRELGVDEDVYKSESATGFRNRAIAYLLRNSGMLDDPVEESVEVYFKQCAIQVTCRDLAAMAATLANGGVNPVTKKRVLKHENVEKVLSVMGTCGMYDYSGEWIYNVGLPAKSGVGGGVLGVLPGQLGVAVFSPRLDAKGNSVRGVRAFGQLSKQFNLHMFNLPVSSDQVIRRVYKLSEAGSHRQRPKSHHDAIRKHGDRTAIIELQGEIFFSGFERLVRGAIERADENDVFVLDLKRVGFIDEATKSLIALTAAEFAENDKMLYLVDPNGVLKGLHEFADVDELVTFENIEIALEKCENRILQEVISRPMVSGLLPFYEFDLFKKFRSNELSIIESTLEMETFEPGAVIVEQGDDADHVYLLAKGTIGIYHQIDGLRPERINSFGPGACFGDLAMIDRRKRSADVRAEGEVTCYTISLDKLDWLEIEHPDIHARIMRNILVMNIDRLRRTNLEISALRA
ncbi:MAG: glutaminase A [Verrucomicrobiota bacterium]